MAWCKTDGNKVASLQRVRSSFYQKTIDDWLKGGIIQPSSYQCRAQVVVVKKTN